MQRHILLNKMNKNIVFTSFGKEGDDLNNYLDHSQEEL